MPSRAVQRREAARRSELAIARAARDAAARRRRRRIGVVAVITAVPFARELDALLAGRR